MLEWKAFELHTHTLHSDGSFSVEELCKTARDYLYDGIALTDHNTMSAFQELTPELEEKTVAVIRGIEWTTFFGHMLVLGAKKYVDWRFFEPDTIDEAIAKIKDAGGIVGIAHPFAIGNPVCTGCRWEFDVRNWENVGFIEVWSGEWPIKKLENTYAFEWWTYLLDKGFKLSATYGRDWHRKDKNPMHFALTYLGIEGGKVNHSTAIEAINSGRTYVTSGPQLYFEILSGSMQSFVGDTIHCGEVRMNIIVLTEHRHEIWGRYRIIPQYFRIISNGKEIYRSLISTGQKVTTTKCVEKGWLRIELYGSYMGLGPVMLAFTSPVYVE